MKNLLQRLRPDLRVKFDEAYAKYPNLKERIVKDLESNYAASRITLMTASDLSVSLLNNSEFTFTSICDMFLE